MNYANTVPLSERCSNTTEFSVVQAARGLSWLTFCSVQSLFFLLLFSLSLIFFFFFSFFFVFLPFFSFLLLLYPRRQFLTETVIPLCLSRDSYGKTEIAWHCQFTQQLTDWNTDFAATTLITGSWAMFHSQCWSATD